MSCVLQHVQVFLSSNVKDQNNALQMNNDESLNLSAASNFKQLYFTTAETGN